MIDICYYSSDFYAPYTGISMYSLCKNNKDLSFRLNCIDTGISDGNKEKMKAVAEKYGKELIFHDYKVLEAFIRDDLQLPICNGSYATYIKVFPDKIFTDIDKVLFLDGDTIIHGSIRSLVETDIDNHVFAAVKVPLINEARVYKENNPENIRLEYALKYQKTGYYNIGVFYCNLKKWAEEDFGNKILATKEAHMSRMTQAPDVPIDEMMMNLAVLENIDKHYAIELPAIYNSTNHNIPHFRAKKCALLCGYIDAKEFDKAYFHPVIIHYCIFKPWYTDTYTRYMRIMKKYKRESPWPDAFEEKLWKTPTQKWFGKWVYAMPTEWLMQKNIALGHCFLRTRARLQSKRQISKERKIKLRTQRNDMIRIKKEKALSKPVKYHSVYALRRRYYCFREGDYRTAFAWPSNYLHKKFRRK